MAWWDLKNDPCPQSCKMMKVRTRKPAAGIASSSVPQYADRRLRYIIPHSVMYGMIVLAICPRLRGRLGRSYLLIASRQDRLSGFNGVVMDMMGVVTSVRMDLRKKDLVGHTA